MIVFANSRRSLSTRAHNVKFHLHISPEELARFKGAPGTWKIRSSDYTERQYWPAYIEALEDAIRETSTTRAPWYVIPSNDKWFRDLAISGVLVETLDEMDIQIPKPFVDLKAIRRQYHSAKIEQTKDESAACFHSDRQKHNEKSAPVLQKVM